MTDDDQRDRTCRVIELLDKAFTARQSGDRTEERRLIDEAAEIDPFVILAIHGGITIGEIPDPEHNPAEWADFVAANSP